MPKSCHPGENFPCQSNCRRPLPQKPDTCLRAVIRAVVMVFDTGIHTHAGFSTFLSRNRDLEMTSVFLGNEV